MTVRRKDSCSDLSENLATTAPTSLLWLTKKKSYVTYLKKYITIQAILTLF